MGKIIALEGLSSCGKTMIEDSLLTQLRLEMSRRDLKVCIIPASFPNIGTPTGDLALAYQTNIYIFNGSPEERLYAVHQMYALDRYIWWNSEIPSEIWEDLRMTYRELLPLQAAPMIRAMFEFPEYFGFDDVIILTNRFTLSSIYQLAEFLIETYKETVSPRGMVEDAIAHEERLPLHERFYNHFDLTALGDHNRSEREQIKNDLYQTARAFACQSAMTSFLEKLTSIIQNEGKDYGLPISDTLNIFLDVPWQMCKSNYSDTMGQSSCNIDDDRFMSNDQLEEFVRYLFLYLQQQSTSVIGHCNIVHIIKGYNGSLQLTNAEKERAIMDHIEQWLFPTDQPKEEIE